MLAITVIDMKLDMSSKATSFEAALDFIEKWLSVIPKLRLPVNFNPVKTKALRLEVTLPTDNATGLFEWSVR